MSRVREQPGLELLKQLESLAEEMLRARTGGEASAFQVVSLGFLARSWRDLQGVLLLCREGLTEQGLVVARSIWEAAVTLEYIRRAPEERARLYIEYDPVLRWRMLQKAERNPELKASAALLEARESRKQEFEQLHQQFRAVRDKYPNTRYWSGKSLRALAQDLGVEGDYDFVYSWISEQAHVEVTAIGRQFKPKELNAVGIDFPDYLAPAVVIASWASVILEAYNEAFKLAFAPRIKSILTGLAEEASAG